MLFSQSADRKVALAVSIFALLSPASASGQLFGDNNCHRPSRGSGSCAATAAPADVAPSDAEPTGAAAAPPTMFAAPAPTGEIAGARNSIALPSLRISLPKVSLETPEFCLHGFTRFRRDPQMMIDGAAAPASHNNPLLFGQLTGATAAQQAAPASRRPTASAAPADAAAAPADGCTSIESERVRLLTQQVLELQSLVAQMSSDQNGRSSHVASAQSHTAMAMSPGKSDPWQNSTEFQLRACEQQVAGLESQITQLQQLVEKLVTQTSESEGPSKPTPSVNPRSRSVDPWSREQQADDSAAEPSITELQAQKIALLEAKLAELETMQAASRAPVRNSSEIAEPLIKADQPQAARPPVENKTKPRTSVLGKLGMSLSRR